MFVQTSTFHAAVPPPSYTALAAPVFLLPQLQFT